MVKKVEVTAQASQVDLNQKIREVIPWVISNYRAHPDKCREVSFCIINELQQQPKVHAIKLLYINYYLCELIINYIEEKDVMDFFLAIFPIPLKPVFKQFLGQLLSLSICLNNKQILNALAHYLEKQELNIDASEIKCFPNNLALHCPQFVTTLLNLSVYENPTNREDHEKLYTVDLLNDWLIGLNQTARSFQIKVESLIRYTLVGVGQSNSHLHYNLLELMQRGHCKPFSASVLLQLVQQADISPASSSECIQKQKLLQLIIVAIKQHLLLDFTSDCKKALAAYFPSNQIAQIILNNS